LDKVDGVVIGAGVVGLAVARALVQASPEGSKDWLVLEAAHAIGTGTSSRNSEVIHAGIYYPKDSLKARLCVQGSEMLYAYAMERGIGHRRCGKLIVATDDAELGALRSILDKAQANGVAGMRWLDGHEARAMEPELSCVAAVHSPNTGIIDSHGLMLSLQGDFENAGGLVACNASVQSAVCSSDGLVLRMADGSELMAQTVINAAGLTAPWLAAKFEGLASGHVPRAYFAKGNYFTLAGKAPFSHLIYPVPQAAGLGVHLTLDLGGQAKFGPDVQWVDSPEDWIVSTEHEPLFYQEVRKYWTSLPDGALQPGYAGIRPKISGPNEAAADFCIQGPAVHGVQGLVNLFGIESPGLTSALAIGAEVARLVGETSA
jgi:L-2-hydroxyglutarate oxidase LhgO